MDKDTDAVARIALLARGTSSEEGLYAIASYLADLGEDIDTLARKLEDEGA